jgi:hypothetical protein
MGSVRLVRRSAPCEYSACAPSLSRSCGRPFLNLRSSSELDHRDPVPSRRLPGMSDDTSSPGLLLPFDTCRLCGGVGRQRIPPPSRAACGVWLPPSRRPPPSLPARQARRSVHGLHPSRTSPHRDRYPSQGPCHPVVTGCTPPSRREMETTWPASWPSSRDESVLSPASQGCRPSIPFLGFLPPELAPVRPGAHFDRGASPLALRRLDVQARPGLRVLRCERVE